ncbi:hypothetical protein BG53_05470 [Paenibacillus darwinianus]|uniref:Group-specific protein n=1 Tax=Paenibacillus darwinianus TaxID=1380763 RepID=A0A9W5W6V9_9BACL|nr:hypothetical protein [Paenibacillus darwinianus]EXX86775.1 hypothetical protein BG53_05470 [Paenibacillus darwinianus]EXX87087.1 hypothetical protein BG52_05040 [Paenibacillus darwinianus]EXX87275.1 hypothetical protein CH50_05505 [Paenibacillus darwinianus]
MGTCSIDHSQEDVIRKLESQQSFLPAHLGETLRQFLKNEHAQQTLNELFHLLKKYDLVSEEEREERNGKMIKLTS